MDPIMKVNVVLLLTSVSEHRQNGMAHVMMKTFESNIRPVVGDILDDPGFHPQYHNGYEVVKVTINYASDECWVSLAPLAIELENIPLEAYRDNLALHGWRVVTKEQLQNA